ncbi:hypothetical protein GQ43DRAFT_434906 [Delitschia confertaspora ATCC 74209]|uniref:Uncharacterized protein n=1 Tax=Delitschia confertaspora ATCC 74209 TaxID=1513339 RepID=A0A9P4MM01_9PLEO|nr:hypothetical protein GQ43DRAFT_434906 [Delitschia confertaspora ATCC 74209]
MKINPTPLHTTQTILLSLIAVLTLSITGTASHTLDIFNKQQSSNPWWLPLWPQHFDTNGTKALIGAAVSTFVLTMVLLVVAVVPRFALKQKYTLRALLSLGTTLPAALVCLVTVIYAHILNNNSPELDTIQTWSCKYKNGRSLQQQDIPVPSHLGNGAFKSVCTESKFSLYATLVVFLLLSLNLAVSIVTWLADKWAMRQQRSEKNLEMGSTPSPEPQLRGSHLEMKMKKLLLQGDVMNYFVICISYLARRYLCKTTTDDSFQANL